MIEVFIDDVVVRDRLRGNIDRAKITGLQESISLLGLQTPISIFQDKDETVLIAGLHRLEACRQLKWEQIPAVYCDLGKIEREIWEIDENLMRVDLTPAQKAEHLARRKELFEVKGGKISPTPGGEQKIGFAADTAAKVGVSKREINQALARAKALGDDIKEVQGTSLDKGVELDALAKMKPEERAPIIKAAQAGEKVTARNEEPTDRTRLVRAWHAASEETQIWFRKEILE